MQCFKTDLFTYEGAEVFSGCAVAQAKLGQAGKGRATGLPKWLSSTLE